MSAQEQYVLGEHQVRILTIAGETWDRLQQAREILDKDGITFHDDRGNVRAHPAVAIARDCSVTFARLVRDLDLEDLTDPAGGRISGKKRRVM